MQSITTQNNKKTPKNKVLEDILLSQKKLYLTQDKWNNKNIKSSNLQKMKTTHQLEVEREGKPPIKVLITQKSGQRQKRRVKTWTTHQDDLLMRLYENYPKKWSIISGEMEDRNQNQCLHRFRRLSQMRHHQKTWLDQEDEMVIKLVKKFGKNWKVLSQIIGTKTGKQIRERYINKLDPKIKKEDWTEEQDLQLISLYTSVGSHWSQIAKKLPGRPQNRIKNRFYSYIRRTYNIKQILIRAQIQPCAKPRQTELIHQNNFKDSIEFKAQIPIMKEELALPKFSSVLIQSSSFFLNEGLIRMHVKTQPQSITSFSYLPDQDCLLYLDYERGF